MKKDIEMIGLALAEAAAQIASAQARLAGLATTTISEAGTVAAAPTEAPVKRGRGRPPGAKNKPKIASTA